MALDAKTRIKGGILKSRLAFVEQHGGAAALERVLNALSEEDRTALGGIISATAWYPFDLGAKLDEAVVKVIGGGDTRFFDRLGEASAEKNLTGVHKDFLVPGNPQAFLAKAPTIYSFYYQGGRRTYEAAGEREGVLTTYDAPHYSAPDCLTVVGWYREALQMCGAKAVRVVEEECRAKGGKVCRYRVSWT
jgi:uncharacterized protein (TIGR02265 family)